MIISPNLLGKKIIPLFVATLFFFGIISSLGVTVAHASVFDFIRAFVTINPLSVEVTAPTEADINRVFKVEANIINKGEVKIENVTGEIHLSPGLSLLGNSIKNVGIVPAEKEKKISWQVKEEEVGKYIVTVSISGIVNGDVVTAEGSELVILLVESPPPGRSSNIFESFFDFLRKWFVGQG